MPQGVRSDAPSRTRTRAGRPDVRSARAPQSSGASVIGSPVPGAVAGGRTGGGCGGPGTTGAGAAGATGMAGPAPVATVAAGAGDDGAGAAGVAGAAAVSAVPQDTTTKRSARSRIMPATIHAV